MAEATTIARRVLDAFVTSGLITADQVAGVREAFPDEGAAGRELLARGLVTERQLSGVLEGEMGIPRVDIESYAPDDEALELLPAAIARRQNLLPLFEIEGMLTVAIGNAADVFVLDDVGLEIGLELEPVLAEADAVAAAIAQYYPADVDADAPAELVDDEVDELDELDELDALVAADAPAESVDVGDAIEMSVGDFFEVADDTREVVDAPADVAEVLGVQAAHAIEFSETAAEMSDSAQGEPEPAKMDSPPTVEEVVASQATAAIDLDVLAVADEHKVAALVAEILDSAVARGASRIHLLPYKNDFYLVFRIGGRLEKMSSAPLAMQGALVDGFKSYAKLGGVGPDEPALGRVHAEIGGKQLVLTISSVPTVAGQRLVVSVASARPDPRGFLELGMSEAETRALQAMAERGRGLLLIAAPVAGGRSSTYYALLSHAASVGKTVYSVESSVEYEIPAVAQVLVNPGSPVGAASYFAAGIRQDTDVLAIDSIQSVEDVHLAIEAAGMGKLVIATFAGADIVSAVRRMLDLGAEPVSLASALTLGVGQRVVRTICPSCASDEHNPLADMIPGAEKGMLTRKGSGCPNCGKSGFAGATGIFEVLPFTEPVRAQIARDGSRSELEAAARAAGMRPMIASGLSKVRDGLVSVDELDRVLRFRA